MLFGDFLYSIELQSFPDCDFLDAVRGDPDLPPLKTWEELRRYLLFFGDVLVIQDAREIWNLFAEHTGAELADGDGDDGELQFRAGQFPRGDRQFFSADYDCVLS